jgi:transposase-like protein
MERRKFTREFKLEAVRLIKERGVSYAQASRDLGVHTSQLRDWVKKFADDLEQAFPGHGQMKPEQLEIARLKREVTTLKAWRWLATGVPAYPFIHGRADHVGGTLLTFRTSWHPDL